MLGSADGSDGGGIACKSGDGTLRGALDEEPFALTRAFGGALDEGAFLLARVLEDGKVGANGSEGMVVAPTFALDFLGLAG